MINFKIPTSDALIPLGDEERALYERLVPEDHYLRRVLRVVDFDRLSSILALSYSPVGSRPLDPVVMLKLEILSRQNDLSDRSVIKTARFDISIRLFLGLSIHSPLPHHTSLTYFRQRVGSERMDEVFDELVGQARRLGLVKDRLRLKDATHIIANIAVPSAIGLIAQTRDQLLRALQPFAAERVVEEQECVEAIRLRTDEQKDEVRLVQRVVHLRAVLAWADGVPEQEVFHQQNEKARANLTSALATAHKVLEDSANPDAKDRILTAHDPEARCGKHGKYYDGYMVDIIEDADSEIITKMKVLPGNGDEGADTVDLIVSEEEAHGNDIEAVSTDGAGYRGDVLRELTDPDGLDLEAFVPPSEPRSAKGFPAELFVLEVIGGRATMSCPGGHTTTTRTRNSNDTGYQYRFDESQCSGCPKRLECLEKPATKARYVIKNDYEAEYKAAKEKAKTAEYKKVRREHPAIERKLGELVRHHGLRQARYRGRLKVFYQSLMTGFVVNLKRIVKLLFDPPGTASEGAVRAELAGVS